MWAYDTRVYKGISGPIQQVRVWNSHILVYNIIILHTRGYNRGITNARCVTYHIIIYFDPRSETSAKTLRKTSSYGYIHCTLYRSISASIRRYNDALFFFLQHNICSVYDDVFYSVLSLKTPCRLLQNWKKCFWANYAGATTAELCRKWFRSPVKRKREICLCIII